MQGNAKRQRPASPEVSAETAGGGALKPGHELDSLPIVIGINEANSRLQDVAIFFRSATIADAATVAELAKLKQELKTAHEENESLKKIFTEQTVTVHSLRTSLARSEEINTERKLVLDDHNRVLQEATAYFWDDNAEFLNGTPFLTTTGHVKFVLFRPFIPLSNQM